MTLLPTVPRVRVAALNEAPLRPDGAFVVYWMTAARRTRWNFAFDRAVDHARRLAKPLVVLEALRCGHAWASDRLHRFVLDGMADNAARCAAAGVAYHPYVEPSAGAGRGLLAALAERAAVVVTDEFPSYFLPRMLAAASERLPVRLEAVDGNGLLPLRATDHAHPTAHSFRRTLQKTLLAHLGSAPAADSLAGATGLPRGTIPVAIARVWPRAADGLLDGRASLAALPIDHGVAPAPQRGGAAAGARALDVFVSGVLADYEEARRHPDAEGTSGLSPYLHFGHVGAHQVFARVAEAAGWTLPDAAPKATGSRAGWWGMSAPAEAFVDQFVTWRELCFNNAYHRNDHDRFESIPAWARATLDLHRMDARSHEYTLDRFESAATHDPVWNAAQRQLVREGRMHNYLRMLWGKTVLEWSRTPEEAFATLVRLNDRYALDGRDPNSYGGISWCFGRFDRAWGPVRPVFGTVRFMSTQSTVRKVHLAQYLRRFGA